MSIKYNQIQRLTALESAKLREWNLLTLVPEQVGQNLPSVIAKETSLAEVGTTALTARKGLTSASLATTGLKLAKSLSVGSMVYMAGSFALDYLLSDSNNIDVPSVPDQITTEHGSFWVPVSYNPNPYIPAIPETPLQVPVNDYDSSVSFLSDEASKSWRDNLADSYLDQLSTRIANNVAFITNTSPDISPLPAPNWDSSPSQDGSPAVAPATSPTIPKPDLSIFKDELSETFRKVANLLKSGAITPPAGVTAPKIALNLEKLNKEGLKIGSGGGDGQCMPIKLCDETLEKLRDIVFSNKFQNPSFGIAPTEINFPPGGGITKADLQDLFNQFLYSQTSGSNIADTLYNSFNFYDADGFGFPDKSFIRLIYNALFDVKNNTTSNQGFNTTIDSLIDKIKNIRIGDTGQFYNFNEDGDY